MNRGVAGMNKGVAEMNRGVAEMNRGVAGIIIPNKGRVAVELAITTTSKRTGESPSSERVPNKQSHSVRLPW